MKREGINYPKFKDQFALMDFEAEPLPALSLYPVPEPKGLAEWELTLTGLAGERRTVGRQELRKLPRVREKSPLVCQIFNWSLRVGWRAVVPSPAFGGGVPRPAERGDLL